MVLTTQLQFLTFPQFGTAKISIGYAESTMIVLSAPTYVTFSILFMEARLETYYQLENNGKMQDSSFEMKEPRILNQHEPKHKGLCLFS